jgi:hypothetical protein
MLTLSTPACFLAISIQTPSEVAWLPSSHCSHSTAEAKRSLGRPSSATMRPG